MSIGKFLGEVIGERCPVFSIISEVLSCSSFYNCIYAYRLGTLLHHLDLIVKVAPFDGSSWIRIFNVVKFVQDHPACDHITSIEKILKEPPESFRPIRDRIVTLMEMDDDFLTGTIQDLAKADVSTPPRRRTEIQNINWF